MMNLHMHMVKGGHVRYGKSVAQSIMAQLAAKLFRTYLVLSVMMRFGYLPDMCLQRVKRRITQGLELLHAAAVKRAYEARPRASIRYPAGM